MENQEANENLAVDNSAAKGEDGAIPKGKRMPKWHAFVSNDGTARVVTASTKVLLKRELRAMNAAVIAIVRGHHKPLQTSVTF